MERKHQFAYTCFITDLRIALEDIFRSITPGRINCLNARQQFWFSFWKRNHVQSGRVSFGVECLTVEKMCKMVLVVNNFIKNTAKGYFPKPFELRHCN